MRYLVKISFHNITIQDIKNGSKRARRSKFLLHTKNAPEKLLPVRNHHSLKKKCFHTSGEEGSSFSMASFGNLPHFHPFYARDF